MPPSPKLADGVTQPHLAPSSSHVMIRGAALSSAGMIAAMAGSLGTAMIYTRVLPENEVGVYLLLLLACDLFLIVNSLGVRTALPKLIPSAAPEDQGTLVSSVFGWQFLVTAGMGLVILGIWLLLPNPAILSTNQSWIGLFPYLWILPLYVFAATFRETGMAAMAGFNRYGARTAAAAVSTAFQLIAAAILVWRWQGGLTTLIMITLGAFTLNAALQHFYMPAGKAIHFNWHIYRETIRFSLPLYANNLLTFAFQRFDTVFVAWLLDPVQVAYYEMAKRLPQVLVQLLNSALTPFLPGISARVAQGDLPGASRLTNRAAALAVIAGYGGVLSLLIIQRPLILALFSEKYLFTLPVLWLLLTGITMAVQAGIMGQTLIALGWPAAVMWVNIATACISVLLNCILIPLLGLPGAGVAFLCAMLFTNTGQTWCTTQKGIILDKRTYFIPHAAMALALALSIGLDTLLWRITALVCFSGICLATRVITWAQMRDMLAALPLGPFSARR